MHIYCFHLVFFHHHVSVLLHGIIFRVVYYFINRHHWRPEAWANSFPKDQIRYIRLLFISTGLLYFLSAFDIISSHFHFANLIIKGTSAAAKSLQSCPTPCDPIDGSPPGSPVPGILQARTLEWVAVSFSSPYRPKDE